MFIDLTINQMYIKNMSKHLSLAHVLYINTEETYLHFCKRMKQTKY